MKELAPVLGSRELSPVIEALPEVGREVLVKEFTDGLQLAGEEAHTQRVSTALTDGFGKVADTIYRGQEGRKTLLAVHLIDYQRAFPEGFIEPSLQHLGLNRTEVF